MHRNNDESRGFSLIEMAIIAMVIGVIVATILPAMFSKMQRDLTKRAKTAQTATRDEILGFAAINGRLPKLEDLSSSTDAWGTSYAYVVAKDGPAGIALDSGGVNINDVTNTDLDVVDGSQSPGALLAEDVAFALISLGPDKAAQYYFDESDPSARVVIVAPNGYTGELRNLSGTVVATLTQPFDDIAEYAILSYAKSKASSSQGKTVAPAGSDVSAADDIQDFPETATSSGAGTATHISVDTSSGEITYDNTDGTGTSPQKASNCLWYTGNSTSGNCTDGLCDFAQGLRVYFEFTFKQNTSAGVPEAYSYGSGFTFTVFNGEGTTDTSHICGCAGHYNGYAGDYTHTPSHCDSGAQGIPYPKLGVEMDVYQDSGASGAYDPSRDHVALLYWNMGSTPNDDMQHPPVAFTAGAGNAQNPTVPSSLFGIRNELPHNLRVDIEKNATLTNTYDVRVWHDCTGCADLTTSFVTAGITPDYTSSTTYLSDLSKVRLGWTFASWSVTYTNVTISSFGVKFLP